jgi:hypothetical protein
MLTRYKEEKAKSGGGLGTFRMNRKLLGDFPLFLQIVLKILEGNYKRCSSILLRRRDKMEFSKVKQKHPCLKELCR